MKAVIGLVLVLSVLWFIAGIGNGDSDDTDGPVVSTGIYTDTDGLVIDSRPGSATVYDRIAGLRNCRMLQREFDQAMDDVESYPAGSDSRRAPYAYAEAALARMEEVGC